MFYKLIIKKMILTLILVISFTNFAFAKSYSLSAINNVRSMWRYSTSTDWKSLNTVKFGRWDQVDNNAFDDIEWLVVKKEKGKALLLSKYCLEKLKFHKSNRDKKLTWATSDLRKILNTTFYDRAFNDEEKTNILNTEVSLDGKIYSDNTVTDKVFILSESELFHYCGNFYESKNKFESAGTPVANTMGTFSVNSYWLRTPGGLSNDFYKDFKIFDFAAITIGTTPSIDVEWENGVRPAIWVKAESSLYDEEIDHNWWKTENNNNDIQETSSEITNAYNNNQSNSNLNSNKYRVVEIVNLDLFHVTKCQKPLYELYVEQCENGNYELGINDTGWWRSGKEDWHFYKNGKIYKNCIITNASNSFYYVDDDGKLVKNKALYFKIEGHNYGVWAEDDGFLNGIYYDEEGNLAQSTW